MSSDRTSKDGKTKEKSASSKKSREHHHGGGGGEERTPKSAQKKTHRGEKHSSTGKQEPGEEKKVDEPSVEPVEKAPTASSTAVKVEEEVAPAVPAATVTAAASTSDQVAAVSTSDQVAAASTSDQVAAASTSDQVAAAAGGEAKRVSVDDGAKTVGGGNGTSTIQVQQESAAQTGPTPGELVKRDELTEALQHFDRNDNGTISAGELRRLLTTMGDKMTDVEVGEFLQEISKMGGRDARLLGSSDRYSRYRHKRISMAPSTAAADTRYAVDYEDEDEEALYRGCVKIADVVRALYPM